MIELVNAQQAVIDREWVTNVYPLYLHDLSEFEDTYYRLSDTGRWEPDHLPDWFSEPLQHPLVIHAGGRRVGFAFVVQRPLPYVSPGIDYRMGEFFILKRHRGQGIGRQAATAVFDRFRGAWEVTELARNRSAIAFWRKVIAAYTQGNFREAERGGEVCQSFTNV